ncbi:hypothetical protein O0I10_005981 [Lichtheimia ornata]|uniref:Uncharacterized protein n=1 Tax=Lichtheimia ornata TaxID=688661 RepID=A0AAD7XZ80_9FUNG|nr:uncharacterized protein O0I10_005981 [Lichtheimia ornata]KAJ8658298.1 hypothetical protein O0I10_005981 [Lichtheimia ornata]
MTLAALSYIPASGFDDHSSRWQKKRFSLFGSSDTYDTMRRQRRHSSSPMVIAAATEKIVKRHHHRVEVVEDEVACDELTAREFAEMAGIKTIASESSSSSSSHDACSLEDNEHRLNIWDQEFWQPIHTSKSMSITSSPTPIHSISSNIDQKKKRHRNSVITKGRFQIVLGDQENDTSSLQSVPSSTSTVVEWKRKRSM